MVANDDVVIGWWRLDHKLDHPLSIRPIEDVWIDKNRVCLLQDSVDTGITAAVVSNMHRRRRWRGGRDPREEGWRVVQRLDNVRPREQDVLLCREQYTDDTVTTAVVTVIDLAVFCRQWSQ